MWERVTLMNTPREMKVTYRRTIQQDRQSILLKKGLQLIDGKLRGTKNSENR